MPINIDNLVNSRNPDEIKAFIKDNKHELTSEQMVSLLRTMSSTVFEDVNKLLKSKDNENMQKDENLEEFIKIYIEYSEQLGLSRHTMQIITALDDAEYSKACVERANELKLNAWDTTQLIESTKDTNYIKSCIERVDELQISEQKEELIASTGDKKYIEDYLKSDEGKQIQKSAKLHLLKKLAELGDLEYVSAEINNNEFTKEEQFQVVKTGGKDFAKDFVLNKFFDRNTSVILMKFIDEPEFTQEAMKKNVLDLPADNSEFTLEMLEKYGLLAFNKIEDDLFSKKAIEVLGKDKVELLIKYYKVANKSVELGSVLENGEEFNKYLQFRKEIFEDKQLETLDLHSAISEFNGNYELISNCMNSELSDKEKKLLAGVLKETIVKIEKIGTDKNIVQMVDNSESLISLVLEKFSESPEIRKEIGGLPGLRLKTIDMSEEEMKQFVLKEIFKQGFNREVLKDFPELRKTEIAKMSDKDQITYMLTGMKYDDYQKKIAQFADNERIDKAVGSFDNESAEVLKNIKVTNKIIELILGLDEEKRKEVLANINGELANEFTEHGSEIANMRNQFTDIDIQIKKIYGKELSTTLAKVQLPDAVHDEKDDVNIIKLEGQDFKLLIHGIDAYGKGSGKFEERAVGKSYLCTSLISEKTFLRAKAGCYYGFNNIGSNALIMESPGDIVSYADGENSLEVSSQKEAEFNTAEEIIDKSVENGTYSEIDVWREYIGDDGETKKVTPDYIVCFSSSGISENDKKEAKRLGIPIVLIDEEKYKEKSKEVQIEDESIGNEKFENSQKQPSNIITWLKGIAKSAPALAQNEAFKTIVDEMSKDKVQGKEAMAHE